MVPGSGRAFEREAVPIEAIEAAESSRSAIVHGIQTGPRQFELPPNSAASDSAGS